MKIDSAATRPLRRSRMLKISTLGLSTRSTPDTATSRNNPRKAKFLRASGKVSAGKLVIA